MLKVKLTILFTVLFGIIFSQEKSNWTFEAHGGFPVNIPLPLTIKQNDFPDIKLTAHFYSEPFTPPIYWVYRVSKWKNNKAWEFEMMHQKLYLKNPPPEVQYFSMTHGYNQLMINRAVKFNFFQKHEFILRLGGGIVLAHVENMVREKELYQGEGYFSGYYVAGPTLNIAIAKQFKINNHFYFNTELKNNTSYAQVPVVNGEASLWHSAFELIGGIGIYIINKNDNNTYERAY